MRWVLTYDYYCYRSKISFHNKATEATLKMNDYCEIDNNTQIPHEYMSHPFLLPHLFPSSLNSNINFLIRMPVWSELTVKDKALHIAIMGENEHVLTGTKIIGTVLPVTKNSNGLEASWVSFAWFTGFSPTTWLFSCRIEDFSNNTRFCQYLL